MLDHPSHAAQSMVAMVTEMEAVEVNLYWRIPSRSPSKHAIECTGYVGHDGDDNVTSYHLTISWQHGLLPSPSFQLLPLPMLLIKQSQL